MLEATTKDRYDLGAKEVNVLINVKENENLQWRHHKRTMNFCFHDLQSFDKYVM